MPMSMMVKASCFNGLSCSLNGQVSIKPQLTHETRYNIGGVPSCRAACPSTLNPKFIGESL